MQKVWSSIDSWKGKRVSLQQPAPAPARGAQSREWGTRNGEKGMGSGEATYTHLYDVLLCCQLVLMVSDREADVGQAGQSSAVYKKLYARR